MEVNKAEIDAVLDAQGRFVWTPNALTLDGQKNIPCDLQEGETLLAFLRRHVPGIESGAWSVSIGGAVVPQAMWAKTYPKHGMHIACRATVGKQVVQLVAVAVLSYFTMGMGGIAAGSFMGLTGAAGWAAAMGAFVAGSVLINKVLGPKVPKPGDGMAAAREVYSLRSQRNSARPYEPAPVLWGEMRVTPDLASQPYTTFAGNDQLLYTSLLGGINVHSASDLAIGDTPLSSFQEVETYFDGFPGHAQQSPPMWGNADSIPGGELVNKTESLGWVQRTTSVGTVRFEVDLEGHLFHMNSEGKAQTNSITITIESRAVGTSAWNADRTLVISGRSQDAIRRTVGFDVPKGQYDVRVRSTRATYNDGTRSTVSMSWTTLRSIQEDTADYSQFGRIALKIKATGQLSGALDNVRATYRAKPMPIWTGTAWVTATTRENGLSNPGAILLQTLRGIWHKGKLQFGFGLSDDQIDMDGLKAFMLRCAAKGYTYDRWITSSMSLQEFCQEVALAGMGEFSWTDGSRPTVVFVAEGQPTSAVVNMANMLKASFSVDYALSNAADGIEYQYVDRDKGFETQTLRVAAPGVTTPLNPARVTGEGVTTEAHAAVLARYHLAQSLYQYKTINFGADIEHLDYRRLSVLSISHDLTQWGYGGRVLAAERVGDDVRVTLDEAVPPLETPHLGLRLPGDRDYRVWKVQALTEASDTLTLIGEWPEDLPLPGDGDNPMDTLWCYDFKATPGYRVRVTSLEPESDLKGAKVTCVPEGPEFWDYVLNGTYVPAPSQTVLPHHGRPEVRNLRVTEQVHTQGDTEWFELEVVWETIGDADHAQVWAGLDGAELRLVDSNALGNRSKFRIDAAGQWLIDVRPFSSQGKAGLGAQVLYITTRTDVAPRNVDEFSVHDLPGGLRRFTWRYTEDKPVALAGVQIRYLPGDVALSAAQWGDMTPLGQPDDVYKAAFETTRPPAGLWTFGIRAINTAGQLAEGIKSFVINLQSSFEQVQQPNLTPPPAPTGLVASGLFATVQVSWDAPDYTQGHGHARTEVWAGATADRVDATKVAEAYAGPASFEWQLGSTAYVWARHVTQDGVAGDWAGPVAAQTAQDVEQLLDVLDSQISESQLKQELSQRIDVIDKANPLLGKSLIESAASMEVAHQQSQQEMNDLAQGLLEAALAADAALERITDAGVYVEPGTGQVKIYGLEATKDEVTQLEVLLDAVQGQLALKATTAYVDGKIAEAVLSPADLIMYEGLDARIIAVTQTLDSINGVLAQKANQLELTNALLRLTSAESTLDALTGQIALRVTRAEYEADQDALNQRLSSAELTLNALDVPSITATVQAASSAVKDAEKQAEALLRDILSGERTRTDAAEALAFARSELSASIQEGLQAEAQARQQLATQFGDYKAASEQSFSALSAADMAEAAARLALAAKVEREQQQLQAQIQQESQARADAVSAEAQQRQQLAARLDQADSDLQAAVQSEQTARVNADGALSQRIDTAQATANNAVAAVQTEQSVRATETGHLGALYSVRMQLSQGGKQVIGGFGLSGTSSGTAGATIDFGVLANKFFVAAPEGSGIASNFQLTIQTTPTTANGVTIPPGLYVDSAYITNVSALWGRFGTLVADTIRATDLVASQITSGYIDADRIQVRSISMDKLKAGRMAVDGIVTVGGDGESSPLVLTPEGEVISNGNGQRARLWSGNVELYKQVPTVGLVQYTALSRVETGVAQSGSQVTIPGYFKTQPSVIVSPRNLTLYKASYAGQDQSVQCEAVDLRETFTGSMVWQFTPRATLSLAANTGISVINQTAVVSGSWRSSTYTTAANTQRITATVNMRSVRGNGSSQYYRRSVRCRIEYLQGGAWVSGAWQTRNLGASTSASATVSVSQTFPSSGAWQFRIYAEAYDTDGSVFGSVAYEYASGTLRSSGTATLSINGYGDSASGSLALSGYTVPAGFAVYEVNYSVYVTASEAYGRYTFGTTNKVLASGMGSNSRPSAAWSGTSSWTTGSLASPSIPLTLTAPATPPLGDMAYFYMTASASNAVVEVKSRRLIANSATASNSFAFESYSYELSSAQVLATGALNWVAIGD